MGFNGTERPGAVYLSAALAVHNQKGLPAFGIYGKDVQDVGDNTIPEDVREKLLRFAKAGLAVAIMRGKSYLSIGSVSMGIGGSMTNPDFLQEYLGMRTELWMQPKYASYFSLEFMIMQNLRKRWLDQRKCMSREGEDYNPAHLKHNREQKDKELGIRGEDDADSSVI